MLDEPTSGLDSHTARYLVSNLRDMAHKMNKMVILTIHQPSSDIFGMFDQIGILSNGDTVYFGGARDMVPYFTDRGFPCNAYTNPLDRYGKLNLTCEAICFTRSCQEWLIKNLTTEPRHEKRCLWG